MSRTALSRPLPQQPQALHLRIGRVVVDAPAGADRQALARALARDLPGAIGARLAQQYRDPTLRGAEGPAALPARIADAVAERLHPGSSEA